MTQLVPAARGPYRKGLQRRAQIVAAATDVFAEVGYTGGSVRVIAERVGVSPSSLVQLFGGKEALLEAVLQDWRRRTEEFQGPVRPRGLAMIRWFKDLMSFHREHRGLLELFLTMVVEATNPVHPAHDFIKQRYETETAAVEQALREACADGEIPPLSEAEIHDEVVLLFAVVDGLELQWLLNEEVDLVGMCGRYVDQTIFRWRHDETYVYRERATA